MGFLDKYQLKGWKYKKHTGIFSKIEELAKLAEVIYKGETPERTKANDDLLKLFPVGYLEQSEKEVFRENNKHQIKQYQQAGLIRKSGKPYVTHPLIVEYILSVEKAPLEALIGGIDHDSIEELVKSDSDKTIESLIADQYLRLEEISDGKINPKTIAKTVVIVQKVTRFESDKNYYRSIDRIFDKNINKNTIGLELFYEIYEKKHGKLEFNKDEISDIIELSACVKLADRIANTLEFESLDFSDRIKDIYKNKYVLNRVTDYINKFEEEQNIVVVNGNSHLYKMKRLKDLLLYVNNIRLKQELGELEIDKTGKNNLDKEREEYIKQGGFDSVDYGFDDNAYSGHLRSFWNKILKKEEESALKKRIETSSASRYVAITGLLEVNKRFEKNPEFTIKGFGLLGTEGNLGYMDDMGKKYSEEWRLKKTKREECGVLNNESFYEKTKIK